jgi:hypothetical protein
MAYPIPPDPRATDDFDVVRGWETMDRRDLDFSDTAAASPLALALGEPLRFLAPVPGVVKVDNIAAADYVVGTNAGERCAGVSWTTYNSVFENGGFPDALATGKVTVLQGKFSCKFNNHGNAYFVPAVAALFTGHLGPAVGLDVVAVYEDATKSAKYACLTSDPAVRYSVPPLAAEIGVANSVIGKVSEISGDYVTVDFSI